MNRDLRPAISSRVLTRALPLGCALEIIGAALLLAGLYGLGRLIGLLLLP